MELTVWQVCGHCASSVHVVTSSDVLQFDQADVRWTCPECGRRLSYVIKGATDADSN